MSEITPEERIIIGSTVDSTKIISSFLNTDKFRLGNDIINNITHDPTERKKTTIPSSKALYNGLRYLQEQIDKIDPNHIGFKDHSVVSLSLIDPVLTSDDDEIVIHNWDWGEDDKGLFTTKELGENSITIPATYLPQVGHYFLILTIDRIDSGQITIKNNKGEEIKNFFIPGTHTTELYIENSDTEYITLQAQFITGPYDIIQISYLSFHRVYDRIRKYIQYLIQQIGVGGTWATEEWVDAALAAFKTELDQTSALADLKADFLAHLTDINPHAITPDLINAADKLHTHTPNECGASPIIHTHTPTECGAAPTVHTHTLGDLGGASSNHTHTPDQCGAAPTVHTHDIVDLGVAPIFHTHTPDECGAAPVLHTHTPQAIGAQPLGNYLTTDDLTNINQMIEAKGTSIPYSVISNTEGNLPHEISLVNQFLFNYPHFTLYSGLPNVRGYHPYFDETLRTIDSLVSSYDINIIDVDVSLPDDTTSYHISSDNKIGNLISPIKSWNTGSLNTLKNFFYVSSVNTSYTSYYKFTFHGSVNNLAGYLFISPNGFEKILDWEVIIDNTPIQTKSISTIDYINNVYTAFFSEAITTNQVIIKVTRISNTYSTYPSINDYWGNDLLSKILGLKIYFFTEENKPENNVFNKLIVYNNATQYNITNQLMSYNTNTELDLSIIPKNKQIAYYFYIEENTENLFDTNLNKTLIPPEFGRSRQGTLLGYIDDTVNSGNIPICDDPSVKFVESCTNKLTAQSVFEDGWITTLGQLTSTLTLDFETPKVIPKIKFLWTTLKNELSAKTPNHINIQFISTEPILTYPPSEDRTITNWNTGITYNVNKIVKGSNNNLYYSILENVDIDPTTDTTNTYWVPIINNVITEYSSLQTYSVNQAVIFNNSYYVSLEDSNTTDPTNTDKWKFISNINVYYPDPIESFDYQDYLDMEVTEFQINKPFNSNYYETEVKLNLNEDSYISVKSLRISISGTNAQTALQCSKLYLYLSQDFYNTSNKLMFNSNQMEANNFYFGYGYVYNPNSVNYYTDGFPFIQLYQYQISDSCYIPVNWKIPGSSGESSSGGNITILGNPYLTENININIYEITTNATLKVVHDTDIYIEDITRTSITVINNTSKVLVLHIKRNW